MHELKVFGVKKRPTDHSAFSPASAPEIQCASDPRTYPRSKKIILFFYSHQNNLSSDDFRCISLVRMQRLNRLRNGVFALGANRLLDGIELFPFGVVLQAQAHLGYGLFAAAEGFQVPVTQDEQ